VSDAIAKDPVIPKPPHQRLLDSAPYKDGREFQVSDMVSKVKRNSVCTLKLLNKMTAEGYLDAFYRGDQLTFKRKMRTPIVFERQLASWSPPVPAKHSHVNEWIRAEVVRSDHVS
jgi:hypothetical protein